MLRLPPIDAGADRLPNIKAVVTGHGAPGEGNVRNRRTHNSGQTRNSGQGVFLLRTARNLLLR